MPFSGPKNALDIIPLQQRAGDAVREPWAPAASSALHLAARRKEEFAFVRWQYQSGDWDVDPRMPSNLLHSLVQYTDIAFRQEEVIIPLDAAAAMDTPFAYLAGRQLFQPSRRERFHLGTYIRRGGFLFVDDCNHDIDGLFAKSFEAFITDEFGSNALQNLPNDHPLYTTLFRFDGPPTTSVELNGWGDNLVHEHLKAVMIGGKIGILYSNKDYGCEWDFDYRNKRWLAKDITTFGLNILIHALTR